MNIVILAGYLGSDPKANDSGEVAKFRMSTKEYSGKSEWHSVVAFKRQAETVMQYLKKGSYCVVTGRISESSWDGADGQKKYKTEILANNVEFGPKVGDTTSTTNDDVPF